MKGYRLKYDGNSKLKRIYFIKLIKDYGIEHFCDLRTTYKMVEDLKAGNTVSYIVKDEVAALLFEKEIKRFPIVVEELPEK